MAGITTYVFFDLETTGLPREELNKTKITELSMLAVKREHILDTEAGVLPRVQHKLTMCFNPGRMISPQATDVTKLDNDLLEYETMFNMKVYNTINSFLDCLEKPVCLIAHNGIGFDFPILKNHFLKLDVSLDKDILCTDSLYAFYDLNKTRNTDENGLSHENNKMDNSTTCESTTQQCNATVNENKKIPLKTFKDLKRTIFYEGDSKPKDSWKLEMIYERIFERQGINTHRAESDCIMVAELSTSMAEKFVEWVDNNHCLFSEVPPMRLGVRLGD